MSPLACIAFTEDGLGHGLYTEAIDLGTIGPLVIERASVIEFNNATQEWEVRDLRGQLLLTDPSRAACVAWEHQHFFTNTATP